MISIHAPRAGRDNSDVVLSYPRQLFQSTRPVRGATPFFSFTLPGLMISIHAPRAGRDAEARVAARVCAVDISIHAPRAGRD